MVSMKTIIDFGGLVIMQNADWSSPLFNWLLKVKRKIIIRLPEGVTKFYLPWGCILIYYFFWVRTREQPFAVYRTSPDALSPHKVLAPQN